METDAGIKSSFDPISVNDILSAFEATCGQQCGLWSRPCFKEDIFEARRQLEQAIPADREDRYQAAVKALCRIGGWRFNEIYRKRRMPKKEKERT
ncbi:hypothetical protein [Ethanoligenens sp.]|uniref:hypothetical protein n=1 Tax=Ethanoligenens sp. TaxID=2099655 RepID=UPI0039E9A823